jgi:hypothetical protein
MAASVRIDDVAFVDPRIELLGSIAGYNRFEALGRLAHLWRSCTDRETDVMTEGFVKGTLGQKGVEALVESGLGEHVAGGQVRVRGCKGRIEWLAAVRQGSRRGGEARRQRSASASKPTGSLEARPDGALGMPLDSSPTPTPTPIDLEREAVPPIESLPESLRTDDCRECLNLWLAHCKSKGMDLTPESWRLNLLELGEMGAPRTVAAIKYSIKGNFKSICEPKPKGGKPSGESMRERMARLKKEKSK